MNKNNDLVSVIIPTYDRAQYLRRALESVRNQTHRNLEIIIVDDSSNDNTPELVNNFIKDDKRVIFLRNDKNQGIGFSREAGINISKGTFISFLDDDDEWLENKIESQLKKAKELNTPTLILCNGFDNVRIQKYSIDQGMPEGRIHFKNNKTPLDYALPNPSHWFFSRAVFTIVGKYDSAFRTWSDQDYLLRIFLNNIPIYYLNQLLVKRYRLQSQEHASHVGGKWIYFRELFLKKHFNAIKKDRHFLFRLYYSIGKDYLKINNKEKARGYFLGSFKLRPYKLGILIKILKTLNTARSNIDLGKRVISDKVNLIEDWNIFKSLPGVRIVKRISMDKIGISSLRYSLEGIFFNIQEKLTGYRKEKRKFRQACGYELNLKNPQSYNEKTVWKKLYDRNPLLPVVSDKYRVRKYLKDVLGQERANEILIPLLYVTDNPETIIFDSLPQEYIIKPNHASGKFMIVEKNKPVDRKQIIAQCKKWLNQPYGLKMHEWAYQKIKRKIVIEELLRDESENGLVNYKFSVLHGKCHLIQAVCGRFPEEAIGYYSSGWDRLDIKGSLKEADYIEKPGKLDSMIDLAKVLGSPFDSIRVDLYCVNKKIYFSELTNYDASGRSAWNPKSYDYELGLKWKVVPGYWKQTDFKKNCRANELNSS